MTLPSITVKFRRNDRLRHPWVFDNEIVQLPDLDNFDNGGLVRAQDVKGRVLGVGFLNMNSRIAFRYLTYDREEIIDEAFWLRRVQKACQYRQARYACRGGLPAAYRLIHGETDGIAGMVADVYGKYVVVQFLALGLEPFREAILKAIDETIPVDGIYERSDSPVRKLEGLEERSGLISGQLPDLVELEDGGAVLFADLKHGAKTGLFLDQMENQKAAASEAAGREVLNCFSYTGLFGLRSACAGARRVIDVEISPSFNQINQLQWQRNELPVPHQIVTENVFDYLRHLDKTRFATDMIVLDPPAFTKNRASRESAIRGYNEINRLAARLLKPGGVLVTCSCSHHISADEFRGIVHKAALDARRSLKLIAERGQPPDHPVLLDAPESQYLKCLILQVE